MKSNISRVLMLGVLISLCIWQTITLWLGDMSGHNFFETAGTSYETEMVYPKQIWANINRNIYKVEGNNEEHDIHYRLLYELLNELKRGDLETESSPKTTYTDLLSATSGVIYEYGVPLTLDEMIGKNVKNANGRYTSIRSKTLYIDMNSGDSSLVYVYLIGTDLEVKQKITIKNYLNYHSSVIAHYQEDLDNLEMIKTYQASLLSPNDSEIFEGNVFYPLNNTNLPIIYRQIKLREVVEGPYDEHLVNYVNDLFKNPNNITKTPTVGGATFSDNLNVSVKYSSVGTLEFKKTETDETERSTSAENVGKISAFIKDSLAIPFSLKKGLYLKQIETDDKTGETYYQFGLQYNNFEVVLSEEVKEKLGLEFFLQLGMKNSQITSGKWMMLELVADVTTNSNTYEYKKESNEARDELLEKMNLENSEDFILQDLECAYIVEDIDEDLGFEWVGTYEMIPKEEVQQEEGVQPEDNQAESEEHQSVAEDKQPETGEAGESLESEKMAVAIEKGLEKAVSQQNLLVE